MTIVLHILCKWEQFESAFGSTVTLILCRDWCGGHVQFHENRGPENSVVIIHLDRLPTLVHDR